MRKRIIRSGRWLKSLKEKTEEKNTEGYPSYFSEVKDAVNIKELIDKGLFKGSFTTYNLKAE